MKFLNILLVAMVVVFLVNTQSNEACRVLYHGKDKLMTVKKDVLHNQDFPIDDLIIRQVLLKAPAPPGGSNPTEPATVN
ncbi:hypothetical protein C1H46_000749 [Malus baccata]|uniref:Ubiquitin-like domain-containing protein n=1 Tax=Malus baccata TaxID=106549 RepID=A0A540NRT3_MALBA|nr:hypothetical protein C1H46_000749 [Malus baccata]